MSRRYALNDRRSGRLALPALIVLALASSGALAQWLVFQHDGQRSGRTAVVGPLAANEQWRFRTEGVPGSPAVAGNGTIYLPSGMLGVDTAGHLYAINPDGTQQWRAALAGPPSSTAPAIGPDGTVYVHTNGGSGASAVEVLQAVNPDGSARFTFTIADGAAVPTTPVPSSPAIGTDGTIYVTSQDGNLYAVDPNGSERFRVSPSLSTISASPAVAVDGTVYVHDPTGLFAYNPDGTPKWQFPIAAVGGVGSPAVGSDGAVYFAHESNDTVYALEPTGTLRWSLVIGGAPVSSPAIAADGTLYVGNNGLYALEAAAGPTRGTVRWRFSEALFSSASPIVGGDGKTYWRETSNLYAVNPDGTQAWQTSLPYPSLPGLDPTPAIGPDRTLYVPVSDPVRAADQFLLAFRTCPAECDDDNPCTTDSCDPLAGCRHQPKDDGAACDDGTVCNGRETCRGGDCRVGTSLVCEDPNPCTANTCDPATGCRFPPMTDGTPCPDNDLCNGAESCKAGACTPGTALDCRDRNACTTDRCTPVGGCIHDPVPGCQSCDEATDCGDGNPCTSDQCLEGICRHQGLADGTSCADQNRCNGVESCQGGFCRPGTPPDCDDDNACTTDTCDALQGCRHANVANGTGCADGNACNGAERCQAGTCQAGTPLNCNDGNPCTIDTCAAASGCQNTRAPNGTSCADGDVCNGAETCQGGDCRAGAPLTCDDRNPCTDDRCDAVAGCRNPNRADGTACADATVCNGAETCRAGACLAGNALDCDDRVPCTLDECNAITGCSHTPIADCTACDVDDHCDDDNPCTQDVCNNGTCANLTVLDGSSCADADACNGVETCRGGTCEPGTALDCRDANPCTDDTCDPVTGCHNAPRDDGAPCPDADLCNGAETCRDGLCTAGRTLDCDDRNGCTTDTCDATDGCQHANVTDGTTCADATVCNGAETCRDGVCTRGAPVDCDDGDPCKTDTCNAVTGCINTPVAGCRRCLVNADCNDRNPCTNDACDEGACSNTAVADGSSCSDGNLCNGRETCQAGVCTGGSATSCDDRIACTRDFCDPVAGCQHSAFPAGSSCADLDRCNGDETCRGTTCQGSAPPTCADGNPCTLDTCDASAGCGHQPLADGTGCGDGDPCNGDETCRAGACAAGPPANCDDADTCTIDGCDAGAGCTHVALAGMGSITCRVAQGLGDQRCGVERPPSGANRLFVRATRLIHESSKGRARGRLVQAGKKLRKAESIIERASQSRRLTAPCADALRAYLRDVRARISGVLAP